LAGGAAEVLASQGETLQGWKEKQPSSFPEYMGLRKSDWVKPQEVLSYFSKTIPTLTYKAFVLKPDDYEPIQSLIIEE